MVRFYPDTGPLSRFQDPIVGGEGNHYPLAKIGGKIRDRLFEVRERYHCRGLAFRNIAWGIGTGKDSEP